MQVYGEQFTPTLSLSPTQHLQPTHTPMPVSTKPISVQQKSQQRNSPHGSFECKGPDGVIFQTTAEACSKLNRYWHNVAGGKETSNTDDPIKLNDTITEISTTGADRMAKADEVFSQMNAYRSARGIRTLAKSPTLCGIAQNRASEVNAAGQIDHSGFDKNADNQYEFNSMGEVLMTGEGPSSAVQVVDEGWARSLTGHKEAIEDPDWTHGCAGVSGNTATYTLGTQS